MKAELIAQGNSITIDKFVFYPNELQRGNPYNTTFLIFVKSGLFSGCGDCEDDIESFKQFVFELQELYDFKRSSVTFQDMCYGSKIVFTMNKVGVIQVKGTVYADAMEHSMSFCFGADQSFLLPFINELKTMIEGVNIEME